MTTNDNKQKLSAWLLAASLATALCGCSGEITDGNTLPAGKYPMAFSAQVDGLNVTRATGKDAWTQNDEIAVSIGGSSDSKTYKINNTSTGEMKPDGAENTLYWQKSQGQRIQAWFPVSATATISDQSSGFSSYDYLVSDGTYNYTASVVELPFKHQMAKVKYILQNGDGISASDFSSATVQIYGYTEVSFTNGALSGNTEGWITPHADREALVVPQQMQNKKFIKVTIGADGAARDYYYTPTGNTDANLEAGKQYTYTITVKKTGLEVTVTGNGVSWTDVSITDTPNTTFQITAPTERVTIAAASDATLSGSNGSYTLSGGNAITVTVDASGNSDKFLKDLPAKGIYDIKMESSTANRYIYTYTLKGDLSFSDPVFVNKTPPVAGDFYYSDGTWSADLWDKPCIGIVFKAGIGTNDALDDYDGKLSGQINGYAVAVQDAARFGIKWSTVQQNCGTSTANDYKGYDNTAKVLCIHDYAPEKYPIFQAISEFGKTTVAPSGSSGWYLPSAGQMIDIVNSWKDNGIIRQKLDALPYSYSWKIPTTEHGYATSTEDPDNQTQKVCRIGYNGSVAKEQKDYPAGNFAVRPVLTF